MPPIERQRGPLGRVPVVIALAIAVAAVLVLIVVYRSTAPKPAGTGVQQVAQGDVLKVGALPVT